MIDDGVPDNHDATVAAAAQLDREGLVTVGLGLGSGTKPLARYFQRSVVEITPERLVDHLAGLLGDTIATTA